MRQRGREYAGCRAVPSRCGASFLAATAFVFLLIPLSYAGEDDHAWELFMIDDSGALWFLDNRVGTASGGSLREVWVRYVPVRRAPADTGDGNDSDRPQMSQIHDYSHMLWVVDCGEHRFRTVRVLRFDRGGRLTGEHSFEGSGWSHIPERSVPEKIGKRVCGSQPV